MDGSCIQPLTIQLYCDLLDFPNLWTHTVSAPHTWYLTNVGTELYNECLARLLPDTVGILSLCFYRLVSDVVRGPTVMRQMFIGDCRRQSSRWNLEKVWPIVWAQPSPTAHVLYTASTCYRSSQIIARIRHTCTLWWGRKVRRIAECQCLVLIGYQNVHRCKRRFQAALRPCMRSKHRRKGLRRLS